MTVEAHRCWAEIDRAALRHNARVARACLGGDVALLAVIKANGYGHGLAAVADALRDDAKMFGVANLLEALQTRDVVPHPVIILGPALPHERTEIVRHRFIASVSSYEEAQQFVEAATKLPVALHCVIDTGMGRMGIAEADAIAEISKIAALPAVELHSVSTHLPSADEDVAFTEAQLRRFRELIRILRQQVPGDYLVHALPSAGVLAFADPFYDAVRTGLMLYGASPLARFQSRLRPAMNLKTQVALVRNVAAGASISYGRTFIAPHAMRVATLSAGYADGIPRAISNRGATVLVHGRRCPILGRVTMDLTMADVSALPKVAVGDEVVLMGQQGTEEISVAEVAAWAATIPWEVFTGIGSRVARVYV